IETGFGSRPSIWTGIPSPAFGWIQTQSTPSSGFAPGIALGAQAPAVAPVDASPANMYGPGSPGLLWGIPTLFAPEITVRALLATVAAKRGQLQGPTND